MSKSWSLKAVTVLLVHAALLALATLAVSGELQTWYCRTLESAGVDKTATQSSAEIMSTVFAWAMWATAVAVLIWAQWIARINDGAIRAWGLVLLYLFGGAIVGLAHAILLVPLVWTGRLLSYDTALISVVILLALVLVLFGLVLYQFGYWVREHARQPTSAA